VGFYAFLDDEDDTTPYFRGVSISHEKQIVNCRYSILQQKLLLFILSVLKFLCIKIQNPENPKKS
jgi:hypothetical protein